MVADADLRAAAGFLPAVLVFCLAEVELRDVVVLAAVLDAGVEAAFCAVVFVARLAVGFLTAVRRVVEVVRLVVVELLVFFVAVVCLAGRDVVVFAVVAARARDAPRGFAVFAAVEDDLIDCEDLRTGVLRVGDFAFTGVFVVLLDADFFRVVVDLGAVDEAVRRLVDVVLVVAI